MTQIVSPIEQFKDANGGPLENGYIYIGTSNLNPETNPIVVYWDAANTIPAAQPLRTISGYVVRNGIPTNVYTPGGDYSMTVRNRNGALIVSSPSALTKASPYISVKAYGAVGNGVTNDQTTLVAAVAYAYSVGAILTWPVGTYVSTASIPNFHLVQHVGPGIVKRGTDLFYVAPVEGQQSVIYASATGSTANDGLSSTEPTTVQYAFNALMFRGFLNGTWRVKLAAGTYSGTSRLGPDNETETTPNTDSLAHNGVVTKNYIIIEGPDVGYDPATNPWPVPTAIFDGAGSGAAGLALEGVKVYVKSIKFKNYNGNSSASGVLGDACWLRCENVHSEGCWAGITNYRGILEVKGGLIYGNVAKTYTGIRSQFLNKHEIGNQAASAIGQGPKISFCNYGILAQEGATGHTDYVQYEDCIDGIRVTVNSRVNCTGSNFKRNFRAIRTDANSSIFYVSSEFNFGTADANTEAVIVQSGGVNLSRDIDRASNSGIATDYLNAPLTVNGTTGNIIIVQKTLDRGLFAPSLNSIRKPQHIRMSAFGTITGTLNTKQLKMRLGATLIGSVTVPAAHNGSFRIDGEVVFLSGILQQGGVTYVPHDNLPKSNYVSTAIDTTTADSTLQFEVQLQDAGDTVVINHCVFVVYG